MDLPEKKASRLYKKLFINNLWRVVFGLYYFFFEGFRVSYEKYIQKRGLKQLKIKYPVVASVAFEEVHLLMHLESRGYCEDRLIIERNYETGMLELARHFIREGSLVIDVGANLGFYSLYFAKKYPSCQVYGYEPVSFVFNSFNKSREINGLSNLHACRMAVGANPGKMDIYAATRDTYNRGISSIKNNYDINETFVTEETNVVILNDHLKDDRKTSFIKMDVQGVEKDVLEGAWKLIERDRPAIVFEHTDKYSQAPLEDRKYMLDHFNKFHYEIYLICEGHNKFNYNFLQLFDFEQSSFVEGDFLAVPKNELLPSNILIHTSDQNN
jgi:FkbM family methyltransferase